MSDHLALWESVRTPDPKYTKPFQKTGGFKGTAIDDMYLIREATAKFGPIGIGWGFTELESRIENGCWFSRVRLWYVHEGNRGEVEQWGGTVLSTKSGPDDDTAKKSVTDAVTKCLSYVGFASDVYMGLFDDSKYVEQVRERLKGNGDTSPTDLSWVERAERAIRAAKDRETIDKCIQHASKQNPPAEVLDGLVNLADVRLKELQAA